MKIVLFMIVLEINPASGLCGNSISPLDLISASPLPSCLFITHFPALDFLYATCASVGCVHTSLLDIIYINLSTTENLYVMPIKSNYSDL